MAADRGTAHRDPQIKDTVKHGYSGQMIAIAWL